MFLSLFFRLVYRVRWAGRDLIPRRGPIIFAANHQSHYDPLLIGWQVADRPFLSVAQAGLFSFGPLAWLMRQVGAIPLKRGRGDVSAVRAAIAQLRAGGCVLIFPEGGRTRDGVMAPFHRGVLVLVQRTKAVVVPVAVDGTYDIWPIGRRFPRLRGRIGVQAGQPIASDELLNGGDGLAGPSPPMSSSTIPPRSRWSICGVRSRPCVSVSATGCARRLPVAILLTRRATLPIGRANSLGGIQPAPSGPAASYVADDPRGSVCQ